MWPSKSILENIDRCIGKLLGFNDLYKQSPSRIVSSLNGIVQIFDVIVRLFTSQSESRLGVQSLDTIIWLPMQFDVSEATVLNQLCQIIPLSRIYDTCLFIESVRVYTERVDISQRGRYTALAEKMHQSMYSLWIVDMEVPKHIWIRNIGLRMAFMTSIHAGKLDGIPNKEDWQIVEDKVLVTILGIDLHSPSTYITNGIA